jgi:hypothetical protein
MTIVLRLLHIICGVLWVGGLGLMVMFIMPAVGRTGAAGGQVMQDLVKVSKVTVYMPVLGLVTVLAGMGLYYHDIHASNGEFARSTMGMTYGIGAAAAILGLIIGGVMTGGSAGKIAKISASAASAGGPPSAAQMAEIGALQARMRLGARISFTLLLITTITMAVARYL